FGICPAAAGDDWPQWLGPHRNGHYEGPPLAASWREGAPPQLWSHEIGEGWSAPIVVDGKVVIYHRQGDQDVVEALRSESGERLWRTTFPTTYKDRFGLNGGPRATPAAAEGRVYLFSAEGVLRALDLADGRELWKVDTHALFEVEQGFFGASASPLVEGGRIFLNIGGSKTGAGLVAFEAATGEVAWKTTNHEASYASAAAATLNGRRWILFFDREGLVQVEPEKGRVFYTYPLRSESRTTVNAASPVVLGEKVFISASYHVGSALVDLGENGPEVKWNNHLSLNNHYATSMAKDGLLFGFHGRQEARPAFR
ncbi:MAG: PQQ-like beta-propeller repeat protein, partial [Acidobacteria bacterium]|nr:PQQ-like beta-propeller repeat protein [Acidobacteriota bacterium]